MMRTLFKRSSMVTILGTLFAMAVGGCGGDTTSDCSTAPTFDEVTLFKSCTACHSSTLEGESRNGAPVGVDFDTYEAAKQNADEALEQVEEGEMPPSGPASDEDIQGLRDWINCGMPE